MTDDLFGPPDDEDEDDIDGVEETASPPEEIGFPRPRAATFSIGHEDIEKRLLDFHASGKMPHALIFAGPEGVGKSTMAYRFARFLFKNGAPDPNQDSLFGAPPPAKNLDVAESDPVFSRISSGGHADLLTIERPYDETKEKFKASVDVEEIRKVAPFFRMTAAEGGWRIVIIDDADTMNRNAQNALLKILEEPPANSLLILIAHRAGALIPTIRSRARVINFGALDAAALKDLLTKSGRRLSEQEFAMLWNFSGGSIGRALKILEADGLTIAGKILDLMQEAPRRNWLEIHKFADSMATEEGMEMFSDIFISICQQLARAKARGEGLKGFGVHAPALEKMLAQSSLEKILKTGDALKSHLDQVSFANLDRRQGVLTGFSLIS